MTNLWYWIVGALLFAYVHGGWLLYYRERGKRADFETDLTQQIYDGNIEADDLRRTRGYESVEQYLEK